MAFLGADMGKNDNRFAGIAMRCYIWERCHRPSWMCHEAPRFLFERTFCRFLYRAKARFGPQSRSRSAGEAFGSPEGRVQGSAPLTRPKWCMKIKTPRGRRSPGGNHRTPGARQRGHASPAGCVPVCAGSRWSSAGCGITGPRRRETIYK